MEISNEIQWLAAGFIMIVLEFTFLPAVGFLFAGLAALTVGLAVGLGLIDSVLWQWIFALCLSVIYAIVLWKPLTKHRLGKSEKPFTDMVGTTATLVSDLAPEQTGTARWSGTNMKARLDASVTVKAPKGAEMTVCAVEGNVLILK